MSMPSLVLSKHNPLQNLLRSKLVYSLHVPGLRVRNYLLLFTAITPAASLCGQSLMIPKLQSRLRSWVGQGNGRNESWLSRTSFVTRLRKPRTARLSSLLCWCCYTATTAKLSTRCLSMIETMSCGWTAIWRRGLIKALTVSREDVVTTPTTLLGQHGKPVTWIA